MYKCGSEIETVEHLFLKCKRWRNRRENIKLNTDSDINTDEIGGHMIRIEKQWDAVSEFTTRVLKKKMKNQRRQSVKHGKDAARATNHSFQEIPMRFRGSKRTAGRGRGFSR